MTKFMINNRTDACFFSVTWPLNGTGAVGDTDLTDVTALLGKSSVLMLASLNFKEKSREVCIKARSPPASLAFIGQVTKHTTVE